MQHNLTGNNEALMTGHCFSISASASASIKVAKFLQFNCDVILFKINHEGGMLGDNLKQFWTRTRSLQLHFTT